MVGQAVAAETDAATPYFDFHATKAEWRQ